VTPRCGGRPSSVALKGVPVAFKISKKGCAKEAEGEPLIVPVSEPRELPVKVCDRRRESSEELESAEETE
jgi:hypothetical protein